MIDHEWIGLRPGRDEIRVERETMHFDKGTLKVQHKNIWARSCKNVSYANNKGADQPDHPRSLISTFVVRCLDSMICVLAISKVSRSKLASVTEQACLNLTW